MCEICHPNPNTQKNKYIYNTGEKVMIGDIVELNSIECVIMNIYPSQHKTKVLLTIKLNNKNVLKNLHLYHLKFIRRSPLIRLRGKLTKKQIEKVLEIDSAKLEEFNIRYQNDEEYVNAISNFIRENINDKNSKCFILKTLKKAYYDSIN